jgi:hypothetical protein
VQSNSIGGGWGQVGCISLESISLLHLPRSKVLQITATLIHSTVCTIRNGPKRRSQDVLKYRPCVSSEEGLEGSSRLSDMYTLTLLGVEACDVYEACEALRSV